ncbi:MAG TPA: DUF1236 domain-containing protein [Pseudolabrys sp.]|nr:DUF1236 domain-containing protein [Pseudolabrys sp.]
MRKAQLFSTVAAALLMSAGIASAQAVHTETQAPARAPAAQRNAPAEKTAPGIHSGAMQRSERKGAETTGQAPNEGANGRPSKPMATGGDNTGSDRAKGNRDEPSKNEMNKSERRNKSEREGMNKSEHEGSNKMGRSESERSQSSHERSSERKSSTTTGQGAAAGRAALSNEQRTKITSVIKHQNVRRVDRASLNVSLNIGTRIPASASVHFYPLPAEVVTVYPEWRGYDYILVGSQIVIIAPDTHEIVYIIES